MLFYPHLSLGTVSKQLTFCCFRNKVQAFQHIFQDPSQMGPNFIFLIYNSKQNILKPNIRLWPRIMNLPFSQSLLILFPLSTKCFPVSNPLYSICKPSSNITHTLKPSRILQAELITPDSVIPQFFLCISMTAPTTSILVVFIRCSILYYIHLCLSS